jgi:hypothetical protein
MLRQALINFGLEGMNFLAKREFVAEFRFGRVEGLEVFEQYSLCLWLLRLRLPHLN